ncbi:protein ORF86 [Lake sturgeon herpesvirus]|nr:protein ORF86 [Lake sturgeon herpesvirus]
MPGYLQSVVGLQSAALMCYECNMLLRDPQLGLCGHRHCLSCQKPKCAQCFQSKTDNIADVKLKITIQDLAATCPKCKWTGNVAQYDQHCCCQAFQPLQPSPIPLSQLPQPQHLTELEIVKKQLAATTELISVLKKQLLTATSPVSYQGKFIWKISNFSKLTDRPLTSEPFYSSHYGYKICVRLYPKGDGTYKNTHLSVFIALMPHEWDAILPWPFQLHVRLVVVNQKRLKDIVYTFQPDPTSNTFQRPTSSNMGLASGNSHLCRLTDLLPGSEYVINDTVFVKVVVF